MDRAFVMASPTMDRHLTWRGDDQASGPGDALCGQRRVQDMTAAIHPAWPQPKGKPRSIYAQRRGMEDKQLEADVTRAANSHQNFDRRSGANRGWDGRKPDPQIRQALPAVSRRSATVQRIGVEKIEIVRSTAI